MCVRGRGGGGEEKRICVSRAEGTDECIAVYRRKRWFAGKGGGLWVSRPVGVGLGVRMMALSCRRERERGGGGGRACG